jgi:glycosyltransferase involved in cell wall biosynthesis
MRVFYYAPDNQTPSWGVGMLYTHVKLLCANGIDARVLHDKPGFRPRWLDIDVPRAYRRRASFKTLPVDLLVIPEIFSAEPEVRSMAGRRIVFVQASSFISPGLREASDYRQLGYQGAIAVMPHVQEIVEKYYGVPAPVVPPCIASYFFLDRARRDQPRKREVALIPKVWCRDCSIVRQMLRDGARALGWQVTELENKSHREVARVLRRAAFHVNVNCHESFNATVPEAMAAGCIPICYEAFGGRDYLKNGVNAFVFPTHHAYPLIERTLQLMASYESIGRELRRVQRGGLETAHRYTEAQTEKALLDYFAPLLGDAAHDSSCALFAETALRRRARK